MAIRLLLTSNGSVLTIIQKSKDEECILAEPPKYLSDSEALKSLIEIFDQISPESREKLLVTISTFFELPTNKPSALHASGAISSSDVKRLAPFTENRTISAKEFLLQKQPRSDVERVACLAFYLTHYLDTPHFKTVDISRLNTEAAQVKFSNAALAVNNATNYGYLASSTKGNKQLSAQGEQFVAALPDRDAAKAAMAAARPRRRSKRGSGARSETQANNGDQETN